VQQVLQASFKSAKPRVRVADIEKDLRWLQDENHHLICLGDAYYPTLLTQIADPPIAFFGVGDLGLLADPKIAVVGSRRPTPAGANLTSKISRELARLGIVITSGMALGVDGISHTSALDVDGSTIAIMGCGLDIVSPARHQRLFERIASRGLLISEYPLSYPASRFTFPQRNRIVSGLSYGVVIVEAAERSGTLITARLAMEQDREVLVVPGSPLNPQYAGSHRLIRQGAVLTSGVADILQALAAPLQSALADKLPASSNKQGSVSNRQLLQHIDYQPTSIDQIISGSGLTASEVSSMLLILEVDGLIASSNGGGYLRVK